MESIAARRTREGCLSASAGGGRKRAGPHVRLPGGQNGEVRRRVRFCDEPTEIVVEGEEAPTLCTGPEGVQQLVKTLRRAVEVLYDGNVYAADAQKHVAEALDQVWEKCGLEFLQPEQDTAAELLEGITSMERSISALCAERRLGRLW
jgi:hypothetical protein